MTSRLKLPLGKVRELLAEKLFNESQIENIIPRLSEQYIKEPKYLTEIIDTWNSLLGQASIPRQDIDLTECTPPLAHAPRNSLVANSNINMNTILGDVEPDLLLLDPKKLRIRHVRLQGLDLAKNLGEMWLLLYNAPRGFYLQDWMELTKKIYYIEHNLMDLLFDKKERKRLLVHPLIKSAAAVEVDFDHIRTRYLFALRSGYKSLAHLYSVQIALDKPSIGDVVLADDQKFLKKFSPFCSLEEYNSFANLIKSHEVDEDDAQVLEKLAELNTITC